MSYLIHILKTISIAQLIYLVMVILLVGYVTLEKGLIPTPSLFDIKIFKTCAFVVFSASTFIGNETFD